MGTAILRSHDCLQGRFLRNDALSIATSHVRSRRNSNPNPNFNSYANQSRRRKRSPVPSVQVNYHDSDRRRPCQRSPTKGPAVANPVMGQIKILKRGENLSPENNNRGPAINSVKDFDLFLGSTDRLGPDPKTLQKQIRVSDLKDGIYAGTAFAASPPPSSVPVPFFLGKNEAATSDLRRLLGLDLD